MVVFYLMKYIYILWGIHNLFSFCGRFCDVHYLVVDELDGDVSNFEDSYEDEEEDDEDQNKSDSVACASSQVKNKKV